LVTEAGDPWSHEAFLRGELSPVFWGSAMTNFGVQTLLTFLTEHTASPMPRLTEEGERINPDDDSFSGVIFKIQANMNPRHRDRIAFMRVVSGRFERGMDVTIGRSGENLRLAKPHSFLAQERSIVEEAFPGDIVGLYDNGKLRVGDTLAHGRVLKFAGIPRFASEHFGQLFPKDPLKRKALDVGLEQLAHEGVIQLFYRLGEGKHAPYLGAVGLLQFEVLKERLKNEYSVDAKFERLSYNFARWVKGPESAIKWLKDRRDFALLEDRNGSPVLLADTLWSFRYAEENAKGLELFEIEPL
ncbi:peptide chain release factor 3, partial [Myxococcota bacterium]|nr:peptide chain release factor 3 [Myxococcota bacterium]